MENTQLQVGQLLFTKDGRLIGNAIVTEVKDDAIFYETDFGSRSRGLSLPEMEHMFHFADRQGNVGVIDYERWWNERSSSRNREQLVTAHPQWPAGSVRNTVDFELASRPVRDSWAGPHIVHVRKAYFRHENDREWFVTYVDSEKNVIGVTSFARSLRSWAGTIQEFNKKFHLVEEEQE